MSSTRQQLDIPADAISIIIMPVFGGYSVSVSRQDGSPYQTILSTGDVTVGADRKLTWYTDVDNADWSLAPDDHC